MVAVLVVVAALVVAQALFLHHQNAAGGQLAFGVGFPEREPGQDSS